jgi:hypothetical protein
LRVENAIDQAIGQSVLLPWYVTHVDVLEPPEQRECSPVQRL